VRSRDATARRRRDRPQARRPSGRAPGDRLGGERRACSLRAPSRPAATSACGPSIASTPGSTASWERGRELIIVRRDRRYLQWKFDRSPASLTCDLAERGGKAEGPEGDGDLAGYAVLRVMTRKPYVGYIVDALAAADDAEAWDHLVAASVDVLQARGVQQVWCVVMNPAAEAALRRFAFVPRDSPMTFFVKPNRPDLDPAFFADGANWFVTKGDADQDRP
jgi:hypothetical protein